jgi:tRNA-uridine 2-sulfurtransferase
MTRDRCSSNPPRVVVGLSGGVDSAVAAALLQTQGYAVTGLVLDTWRAPGAQSTDGASIRAQAIADHLGIPLVRRDVSRAFFKRVVRPFVDTYAAGRTPNPCVLCNPTLKLATLIEEADAQGAPWIATGHYARVVHAEDGSHLLRARAGDKDQSYALYRLGQPQLSRLLLPLGTLESKAEVREIARRSGLPVSGAEESQDLCFVAEGGYADLLASLQPAALRPGPVCDLSGEIIGEHQGLALHTVGQRIGGLGHSPGTRTPGRRYVLALDPDRNAVVVGPKAHLSRECCALTDVTFTAGTPPAPVFEAQARMRYRAPLVGVTVAMCGETRAEVSFSTPQFGVAPGQSLVLYGPAAGPSGDECLGGGFIVQAADHALYVTH